MQNWLLIKDHTHNVFMLAKHLECGIANLHFLILFYGLGGRGSGRLIAFRRVTHLVAGRAKSRIQCPHKSTLHIPPPLTAALLLGDLGLPSGHLRMEGFPFPGADQRQPSFTVKTRA